MDSVVISLANSAIDELKFFDQRLLVTSEPPTEVSDKFLVYLHSVAYCPHTEANS